MTPNRVRCLEFMRQNIGVPIVVVTPKNIAEFIVPEFPFHPAYEYLSLVHKSDYLRTYLLHVHGGGYCDIKEVFNSWIPFFEETDWITGYPEIGEWSVGYAPHQHLWSKLIGCGAYIVRPRTEFTEEWLREANALLDTKLEELKKNPADNSFHGYQRPEYPIKWIGLLGEIFHRILPKYFDHVKRTLPAPNFMNYR